MWAGMASAAKTLGQLERGYCRAEAHVTATHGDANGAAAPHSQARSRIYRTFKLFSRAWRPCPGCSCAGASMQALGSAKTSLAHMRVHAFTSTYAYTCSQSVKYLRIYTCPHKQQQQQQQGGQRPQPVSYTVIPSIFPPLLGLLPCMPLSLSLSRAQLSP
jgi:hypothetical protein